ncbi:hypothetical protein J1N35_014970 [Gossypium stocksii]|uniref:Uncharacterized protein n=1 Tax=Gossypium stocksii TaxID=47602 RepID=A0A9D3VXF4_9ROSI|nr:hypothetical protein J1N35_014970 [Gossypium stocksii]
MSDTSFRSNSFSELYFVHMIKTLKNHGNLFQWFTRKTQCPLYLHIWLYHFLNRSLTIIGIRAVMNFRNVEIVQSSTNLFRENIILQKRFSYSLVIGFTNDSI